MKRRDVFQKSLDNQWCIQLWTKHPDKGAYAGVVTHLKKAFMALEREDNFAWDGTHLFPYHSLKSVRDKEVAACHNAIIRQNGTLERLAPLSWLSDCDTLFDVVTQLKERDIWPAVEVLFDKGTKDALYIGPITRVTKTHFFLWCYDAAGEWEKEYRLTYKEIFRLEIDGAYLRHFNAYMRGKARPSERAE